MALNAFLVCLPGMCTIHANSAREALVKVCTLPLLGGQTPVPWDEGGVPMLGTKGSGVTHPCS